MSTYYARKFGTDHDGECDMRAEAEELRRDALEDYDERPVSDREHAYGMCTACGSVEVRLDNATGTRDLSGVGESATYPTGYGCEVCS